MASKNCCSVRHTSWCRVPRYSDTRRAHFKSTDPSKPTAYVFTIVDGECFTTSAVTMELSRPPDKRQPTGRSLISRLHTAASNNSRTEAHALASNAAGGAFTSSPKDAVPKL